MKSDWNSKYGRDDSTLEISQMEIPNDGVLRGISGLKHCCFLCIYVKFQGGSGFNQIWLVVSTHLKNISQIGNLPQIGVKIKNI